MRTPTGITGLDEALDGGIPQGAIVLVAGEAGSGKTIFGIQFILAGIAAGEPGVIGTFEDPGTLYELAASLGWDLRAAVNDGYAAVVQFDSSTTQAPVAGAEDSSHSVIPDVTLNSQAAIDSMLVAIEEIRAERVTLDRMVSPLVDLNQARKFVGEVTLDVANESYCSTLLTGFRQHDAVGYTMLGVEEQISDGIINLELGGLSGEGDRLLSVRKMHGTSLDLAEHPYVIEPGRGFVFY